MIWWVEVPGRDLDGEMEGKEMVDNRRNVPASWDGQRTALEAVGKHQFLHSCVSSPVPAWTHRWAKVLLHINHEERRLGPC